MTRDEFIKKYRDFLQLWKLCIPDNIMDEPYFKRTDSLHDEFISDLDDMLRWYKHELWDEFNKEDHENRD